MGGTSDMRERWAMPAVKKSAPLKPVPIRQAEVGKVIIAAITYPLRLPRHWASDSSRPLVALMPSQSREDRQRPVPGTNSFPSRVPGRVASFRP
jgi:hypothetical protein